MKKLTVVVLLLIIPLSVYNRVPAAPMPIEVIKVSNFRMAYERIRFWEGGYSNHPMDAGGRTYAGISYRYHKDWYGWRYVGEHHNRFDLIPAAEIWVLDFYLDLWHKEGFDELDNPEVAVYIFDMRVNISRRKCVRLLNKLGANLTNETKWVSKNLDTLDVTKIRDLRIEYYNNIVKRRPSQIIFLKGWLTRAQS